MPELPDVQVFKEYMDATSLHKSIERVAVHDKRVLKTPASTLSQALVGESFESTQRHGKHLFAELGSQRWLRLHFGMTGTLKYFKQADDEPEYSQVLVEFGNGYHLSYVCQRLFGDIELIQDVERYVEKSDLGPDALGDDFDLQAFKSALGDRRGMIKPTLMNQHILAGIGNIYADEILYQAQVHPETKANALTDEELEVIYQEMCRVLEIAIDRRARPSDMPNSFIIPQRHADGTCPSCDTPLIKLQVSSRSTYICPKRQQPGEDPG